MRKYLLCILAVVTIVITTSCSSVHVIPKAKSTVNAITLKELNLTNSDYTILNTISESAIISVTYYANEQIDVRDAENTFSYTLAKNKSTKGTYIPIKQKGVIRAGFLSNDYGIVDMDNPEDMARCLAIYRLINRSQELGADGLVEPVISTNIEGTSGFGGELTVSYKTTVSAKPIKLRVTGK